MDRVIITGATGAIGIALINKMIEQGKEVLVFCREGSKRNEQVTKHPLVEKCFCSMQDLASIENKTRKRYDVFYHFAWEGTVGAQRNDMYLQNQNVKYALDAVCAAKRFGCHTFIGAGSQAEYGRVEGMLTPNTPVFPENGYGMGKLCAGQMTREHAHQCGLKHMWVRILSVYGPYDGKQSMVMATIDKLKAGITPQFTKGEQMWDYLFSSDAASAFYLLGDKGTDGKTYVLGSGQAMPLAEYIRTIRDVVAPNAQLDLGAIPYAPKQVMHLQADISELNLDCGWQAQTTFSDGIIETVKAIE